MIGWGVASVMAAEVADPMREVAAAYAQLGAGDASGALARFSTLCSAHPDLVDAAVGRGLALAAKGRVEEGRQDLLRGLDPTPWSKTKQSTVDFQQVDTETRTLDNGLQRQVGLATLAVFDADQGRSREALALLDRAERVHGQTAALQAARARAEIASGQAARGWERLATVLAAPDPSRFSGTLASRLVAANPAAAPPAVYAALERLGQWTATYNRAAAQLQLRAWVPCLEAAREGMERFRGEGALVSLAYTCGARADGLVADALVDLLGGVSAVPVGDLVAHADTHVRSGVPARALELLRGASPREAEDRVKVADAVVRAALAVPDLDAAREACRDASPEMDVQVAFALGKAERLAEAERLLGPACGQIQDATAAAACRDLASWVAGRRADGR